MVVNKQHLSLNPLKSTNPFLISENATLLPLLLFSTFLDFYCLFLNFPFFPPFHLILSEAVPLIYIKMRLYRIYHLYSVGSFPSSRFFFFFKLSTSALLYSGRAQLQRWGIAIPFTNIIYKIEMFYTEKCLFYCP